MKKSLLRGSRSPGFIVPPAVVLSAIHVGGCSIWFLWILVGARHATLASGETLQLLSTVQYFLLTAANLLLGTAVVVGGLRSRGGPPLLRRAHLAGRVLTLVTLGFLQLGAHYASTPLA